MKYLVVRTTDSIAEEHELHTELFILTDITTGSHFFESIDTAMNMIATDLAGESAQISDRYIITKVHGEYTIKPMLEKVKDG